MRLDRLQLLLELLEAFTRLGDDFRLGAAHEVLVGQLAFSTLFGPFDLLSLLLQTGPFGLRIDHIVHVNLYFLYYRRGGIVRFWRPFGRLEARSKAANWQTRWLLALSISAIAAGAPADAVSFSLGLFVLVSDITNGANRLLDESDCSSSLRVQQRIETGRPLGDAQALGVRGRGDFAKPAGRSHLIEIVVNALGDERHKRMQQLQDAVQDEGQHVLGRGLLGLVGHAELDPFEVPVAEVVPEEAVEL